ncbi:amidohydrolase [Grimontia hollisae]|uniref:Exoenzymes regulatory protein AepA n=1 Tax=Grimontia hollisae CIP 101886 TaxID=675812 RepID=D0I682_GRIHO|nr:amidohydrolase [Grimontia hollisae]AMG31651.1 amidohydrolase [Grimontia hollisae]EEY72151.1 exoenzymes regulatory protein AepA [Grimontia hollisae CIP 101886]MDF2186026.1 amidohydrolase [Grimontia hollisae]STO45150.1 N-substituted formamide deformylase precursor [Grimontia hollisae]STQ75569.1 N-substituted formamide deformylase precursor [Grimontia hollisae]
MKALIISLSALLIAFTATAASPTTPFADTIYHNAQIITVNDTQPEAQAVAILDGKILAVGDNNDLLRLKGDRTKVVDLKGLTMIPGFIDAHGHVMNTGLQAVSANLLSPPDGPVTDIATLQEALRKWADIPVNKAQGFIIGFGYDDSQLKEKVHPTRFDLDKVSTDVPILIIHQSGHLGVMNSKALEMMKLTANSKNPPGGVIRRIKGNEEPNGVLEESAFFGALIPLFSQISPDENEMLFRAGMKLYAKYGYTTAQEGRAMSDSVKTMYEIAQKSPLPIDVVAYTDIQLGTDILKPPYLSKDYTNGFRLGGVKLTLDGSPQGKTAWLTKPYKVPPDGQNADYRGYPIMSDEDAEKYVSMAMENGWQLLTHANGDASLDQYLRAMKKATEKFGAKERRFVAIHAQTAREDQVQAFKELNVLPSFFPMHTFYWGDWHAQSVLGDARAENISPTGWALDRGMIFTSHHDAPVAFPDSMRVYSATVNRITRSGRILGKDQRVSSMTALKAQTLWSAYQHFEEATKGSIEVGKVADLVLLSDNPLKIAPLKLADISVLATIKHGKIIYTKADDQAAVQSCAESKPCQKLASHTMMIAGLIPHKH